MGSTRRSRIERPEVALATVTARDLELLRGLGRMRISTTSQLRRLFIPGRTAATRRLATLHGLGLVRVHVVGGLNSENLYSLTAAGLRLLVDEGVAADELHVQRSLLRPDLHTVAVNDLRIALVLAARERPDVRVEFFAADHDLKRQSVREKRKLPAYVPDALVRLAFPAGALGLVVEFDRGTEHRAQFEPKVTATVDAWRRGAAIWGLHPFRPLLVTESEARVRFLSEIITRSEGGALWLVAEKDRFEAAPFGGVVTTAEMVAATPRGRSIDWNILLVPPARGVR